MFKDLFKFFVMVGILVIALGVMFYFTYQKIEQNKKALMQYCEQVAEDTLNEQSAQGVVPGADEYDKLVQECFDENWTGSTWLTNNVPKGMAPAVKWTTPQ